MKFTVPAAILVVFLAACSPASSSHASSAPAPLPSSTPGLVAAQTYAAQSAYAAQTQAAQAQAVLDAAVLRGVEATQARQMTAEALADRATQDSLQAQQETRHATQTAAAVQSTSTAEARAPGATIEARRTVDAATAVYEANRLVRTEEAKREENVTTIQTGLAIMPGLWSLVGIIAVSVLVWITGRWLYEVAMANARSMSVVDTPHGPLIISEVNGLLTAAPAFAGLPAPVNVAASPERHGRISPQELRQPSGARVLQEYRTPAGANRRAEVLELLRAALKTSDEENQNGKRIPGFRRLPGYETRPQPWVDTTRKLEAAGLVYKVADDGPKRSGVYLCGQWTIYALLSRLEAGSVSLEPVNVAENVTKRPEITLERSEAEGVGAPAFM